MMMPFQNIVNGLISVVIALGLLCGGFKLGWFAYATREQFCKVDIFLDKIKMGVCD